MPMRSVPIVDLAGRRIGVACYRESTPRCATTGCSGAGTILCDFPVKRRGRDTTCNRRVCRRCAVSLGKGQDFCPPHARAAGQGSSLVTVCAACLSSSCGHLEQGYICEKRSEAGTKVLTVAQWKAQLSFGVVK